MLHDICVGKTGTLTKGDMHVRNYQLFNNRKNLFEHSTRDPMFFKEELEMQSELKNLIIECIISNTDV